jgi:hypothetical protein
MNEIETAWRSYAAEVIPPGAPEVQLSETRRAFYAGVFSLLEIVKVLGTDAVSEEAGVFRMEMIDQEIQQFYRDVKEGKK